MYSILVVGAGYLGSHIARDFKARKQKVFALTRNPEKAAAFEKEEINPVIADLTKPETLQALPPAHFIVLCAAPDEGDEESYRRIYLDGIKNFLDARKNLPRPHLIVLISSTSVWKERSGEWVDEETPADGDSVKSKILLASENLVLNSGFPAVVLRLSGIYGPGRNRLNRMRSGAWPAAGEPDGYMNMIHVQDAVNAMIPVFKESKEGAVYTVSDDEPVLKSEFCRWMTQNAGVKAEGKIDTSRREGKRCRNTRLKELKVKFQYPTFREGYTELLNLQEKA